jgi:hypothetical protein
VLLLIQHIGNGSMHIEEQLDTLQSEIDQKRQEIRSDYYSMSIGELISLYEQKEIEIHPEFQRFFRWEVLVRVNIMLYYVVE